MTTLMLDWDGRSYAARYHRLRRVLKVLGVTPRWIRIDRTRNGWHCVVMVTEPFLPIEVVAIQAMGGSDAHREAFNFRRVRQLFHPGRHAEGTAPKFWRQRWNVLYKQHERGVAM